MTEEYKPLTSGEAFAEARQNIKNAEQFADAGRLDKAYLTAYIAEKWTGLGNTLQLREQSERWNTPATSLPLADGRPKHAHGTECEHAWVSGTKLTDTPTCDQMCGVRYTGRTRRDPCPAVCPEPNA